MKELDPCDDILVRAASVDLMKELGLTYQNGAIGINDVEKKWHVFIFDNIKKPPLIKWYGWNIVYHIYC